MTLTVEEAVALLPGVPLFESPFLNPGWAGELGDRAFAAAIALRRFGFAIVDLGRPDMPQLCAEVRETLDTSYDWDAWHATGAADMRLQDAWRQCDAVRRLAADAGLAELLARVYGREMVPFQTLNFACGSQQHLHADSVHFNTVPDGFMCGVWIALQDVDRDCGPLTYAPGSQRYRFPQNLDVGTLAGNGPRDQSRFHDLWRALVAHTDLSLEVFLPKRGQALIWSAHLLHGGDIHRNLKGTRWSQVTHYFGRDCLYLTPMLSNATVGPTAVRSPVDVRTGQPVELRIAGAPVDEAALKGFTALVPSREQFDAETYLRLNPDVAGASLDPYDHYVRHGRFESRQMS